MIYNIFFTIATIASLMFLDFYLTIKGAKLYKQKFSEFIKVDNYEMNPAFQKSIADFKYSLKHLLGVIVASSLVYFCYSLSRKNIIFNPQNFNIVTGLILTLFGYINANHLKNIMVFKAVNKNPEMLKGQVQQSYQFSLKNSQAQIMLVLIPLLIILIVTPSYFVSGAVLGLICLYLKIRKWKKKSVAV